MSVAVEDEEEANTDHEPEEKSIPGTGAGEPEAQPQQSSLFQVKAVLAFSTQQC